MSKYGGDLTDFGQTSSLHGKNIDAYYRAPKKEQQFANEVSSLKEPTLNELIALVPKNWHDDTSTDYWVDERVLFSGKDGQTNAYVKRGVDDEDVEILDRQQTNKYSWFFATEDNHIHFLAGGKIYARGREWFLLKVITQDSTSSTTNKYSAMDTTPYSKFLLQLGLKTLVLV